MTGRSARRAARSPAQVGAVFPPPARHSCAGPLSVIPRAGIPLRVRHALRGAARRAPRPCRPWRPAGSPVATAPSRASNPPTPQPPTAWIGMPAVMARLGPGGRRSSCPPGALPSGSACPR